MTKFDLTDKATIEELETQKLWQEPRERITSNLPKPLTLDEMRNLSVETVYYVSTRLDLDDPISSISVEDAYSFEQNYFHFIFHTKEDAQEWADFFKSLH